MTDSKVIGVLLLVRHGDREGFYQDPTTYTASNTVLTPLGNQQEFAVGAMFRSLYLNESSPSYIQNFNGTLVNDAQIEVRADAGDEGPTIVNSAISFLQGLFPPNLDTKITLANTTNVTSPLGGYQYIPIESVEPTNDISLEGFTSCNTFDQATSNFYNSTAFKQMANDNADFLQLLPPFLDGRPVTLENMWNIYDFMNVQYIHNEAFSKALPLSYLERARYLADWHEYNVFSDPELTGIGNIAGQTIIPSMSSGFQSIMDNSNPIKLVYMAISYKPFLSLFNMTQVAEATPQLAAIVNYAAAAAFEIRQQSSGDPVLRFKFMNGTEDDLKTYPILGSTTDIPVKDFLNFIDPVGINSLNQWCSVCANTQDRGCGALSLAASEAVAKSRPKISPVGAGFLGFGLTLAVSLVMICALVFFGLLSFGRKRSHKGATDDFGHVDGKA